MSQAKKPYWCLNAVRHDKKRYETKARIELTDEEAAPLLAAHAITRHDPAKKAEAEAKAKQEAEAQAKKEAEDKAKAEAEAKAKAEAEAKAKQ